MEAVLRENKRCALFTENPRPLRARFAAFLADWRLIPLCSAENVGYAEFYRRQEWKCIWANQRTPPMLSAAFDYIGVPEELVVSDYSATHEVISYIATTRPNGLRKITFTGISKVIIDRLELAGFSQISRVAAKDSKDIQPIVSSQVSTIGIADGVLNLFEYEIFCASH
jgi:hypothetical protein